jgi:hypothetical protein
MNARAKFELRRVLGLVALLYLSLGIATFIQLVVIYGLWNVVSTPIYPVKMKGHYTLSNGDVLSDAASAINFVLTVIFWCLFIRLNARWLSPTKNNS